MLANSKVLKLSECFSSTEQRWAEGGGQVEAGGMDLGARPGEARAQAEVPGQRWEHVFKITRNTVSSDFHYFQVPAAHLVMPTLFPLFSCTCCQHWRLPACRLSSPASLPLLIMFCSLSLSWPHPSASRSKSKVNFLHEPSISPTPALIFYINTILPDNVQKDWRLELRHGLCPHHTEPTSESHCALYSNQNTQLETL